MIKVRFVVDESIIHQDLNKFYSAVHVAQG